MNLITDLDRKVLDFLPENLAHLLHLDQPIETWKKSSLEVLDLDPTNAPPDCFISGWFQDGRWNSQVFLGIPLSTLMSGNLGPDHVPSGTVGVVLSAEPFRDSLHSALVNELLVAQKHQGFVTMWLDSISGRPTALSLTLPGTSIYNVLEGVRGSVMDWGVSSLQSTLLQSWTSSILLSRSPFPYELLGERVEVSGIFENVERHFFHKLQVVEGCAVTDSTILGIASCWGRTPVEANNRAVSTCRNVKVGSPQFRTDGEYHSRRIVGNLRAHGYL